MAAAETKGLFDHLGEVILLLSPLFTVIIGLVVWAWTRMEKNQDKLEKALDVHIVNDCRTHDLLFTQLRAEEAAHQLTKNQLNVLQGEHNNQHDKD